MGSAESPPNIRRVGLWAGRGARPGPIRGRLPGTSTSLLRSAPLPAGQDGAGPARAAADSGQTSKSRPHGPRRTLLLLPVPSMPLSSPVSWWGMCGSEAAGTGGTSELTCSHRQMGPGSRRGWRVGLTEVPRHGAGPGAGAGGGRDRRGRVRPASLLGGGAVARWASNLKSFESPLRTFQVLALLSKAER